MTWLELTYSTDFFLADKIIVITPSGRMITGGIPNETPVLRYEVSEKNTMYVTLEWEI